MAPQPVYRPGDSWPTGKEMAELLRPMEEQLYAGTPMLAKLKNGKRRVVPYGVLQTGPPAGPPERAKPPAHGIFDKS